MKQKKLFFVVAEMRVPIHLGNTDKEISYVGKKIKVKI